MSKEKPLDDNHLSRLSEIVYKVSKEEMQILEIGTGIGQSAFLLAEYASKYNGKITCIDTWLDKKERRIWEANKLAVGKLMDCVKEFRGDTRALLPEFLTDSMDFIYLRGNHLRERFTYDIKQCLRILKKNGTICIFNCHGRVTEYDKDWLEMHDGEYAKCADIDYSVYPGVIMSVDDVFKDTGNIVVDHFYKTMGESNPF